MNPLVLVVDDEPDVEVLFRQQFRRDLRAGRFTMEFAQSAPMALQRITDAAGVSLILILSDINMPGMSGLELLPKAKALRPDVPIIMITAYGPRSVVLLIIHREDIAAVASKHSFGRGHEDTTLYFYFLVAEKCRERLGMHAHRLVRFIKDGEVELYASLSCRRSQLGTALIGREYDLGSAGAGAKQCRNLDWCQCAWADRGHRLRRQIRRAQGCQLSHHCKHKANLA